MLRYNLTHLTWLMGEFPIFLKFTENDLEITSSIIVASLEGWEHFGNFYLPGPAEGW
jgi:hypothetical protein